MQLTAHLGGVHGAIGKLSEGIEAICAYLQVNHSESLCLTCVLTFSAPMLYISGCEEWRNP